jgi:small subunit ribosomal protein S6
LGVNVLADNSVVYEGLFILDANRYSRDNQGLPSDLEGFITSAGGEVLVSRLWEERRLAYPIKGQRKGAYWLTYFRLPKQKVGELTRQCEIKDGILRQMFVRLPESLVEHVVAHAKGESIESPEAEEAVAEGQEESVSPEGQTAVASESV